MRWNRAVADGVVAGVFLVLCWCTPLWEPWVRWGPLELLPAAAGLVVLVARRRVPTVAVLVLLAALLSGYLLRTGITPYQVALGVALHCQAQRYPQWRSRSLTAGVAVVLAAAVPAAPGFGLSDAATTVAWAGLASIAGEVARHRRALLAAAQERVLRAEAAREQGIRRQVAEERLQIARDVHDVVGHRIAVMNVQAAVATRLLPTDPAAAEAALAHVRAAGTAVLAELSGLLTAVRAPVPELDALPELITSLAAAGFLVETTTEGVPRPLPPLVGRAAYRIVQEALTNALKHGAGHRAWLRLTYGAVELELSVRNELGGPGRGPSGGNGIPGMRERARSAGGSLTVGRDDAQFAVAAVLPLG
ncbi:sensor histidine kinase [Crossiella sp. CA198]|uniref:sensor histidine kinase n=1 Tax=Crossiella sp. CA198 TaxID=3455607 RepID=UPI003F8D1028